MSRNAVRVSSVSASGSTSRNVRPAASTVRTPSVVRRRYGVVSGPRGRRSVYARSLIGCRPYSRPYRGVMSADEFRIEHDTMGEVRVPAAARWAAQRSEEHTSDLQSLMRISYAVFCLKKKKKLTHEDN